MTPPPWLPSLDLHRHTLDNGLEVILNPDPQLPLVAVNLWYHVGSKNERPGRTGFAHLFEHMLFQGSEHVGNNDHFAFVQQVGGVANGSTWYDRTNYYETLPAQWLELGLWLESDRMGFLLPALTPEKLETQRRVVMNERRERVDNQPYGRALERLHELLYPAPHPYHWPVIGYLDDIAAATLEEVRDFFSHYYGPANAVLTLCGRFEPDHARELVGAYFESLASRPRPEPVREVVEELDGPVQEELPDRVELDRVYLAFRAPAFGQREWYAADLLTSVLSDGRSSPLYRDLVKSRELAQGVGASVLPTELTGTLIFVATARPGVVGKEVETALWEHLHRLADQGPTEADLERARHRALTAYAHAYQLLDRRADLLSQLATLCHAPERAFADVRFYLDIDGDEVQRLARQLFRPAGSVTVTVVPEERTG